MVLGHLSRDYFSPDCSVRVESKLLVVSVIVHVRMMEAAVLLGTFTEASVELIAWFSHPMK